MIVEQPPQRRKRAAVTRLAGFAGFVVVGGFWEALGVKAALKDLNFNWRPPRLPCW